MTLLAGEVNNSERLLLFLFLAAEEALPEVSLGAEAAPMDRDRCFGGMIVLLLRSTLRSLLCVVAVVL